MVRLAPIVGALLTLGVTFVVPSSVDRASAHAPGVVLTGFGTGTIDGTISPGEWDSAGCAEFSLSGATPANICAMNDLSNLYLAVRLAQLPDYR